MLRILIFRPTLLNDTVLKFLAIKIDRTFITSEVKSEGLNLAVPANCTTKGLAGN